MKCAECGIQTFQREIFVVISVTRVPLFVLRRDKIWDGRNSGLVSPLISPDRKLDSVLSLFKIYQRVSPTKYVQFRHQEFATNLTKLMYMGRARKETFKNFHKTNSEM